MGRTLPNYRPHKHHKMGGGHKINIEIPDWRSYKTEGIKEIEWTQRNLAAKGLKDPWARNEVWKYKQWPGYYGAAKITIFRGFKVALLAMGATVVLDYMLGLGLGGRRYMKGHDHH